MAIVLLEYLDKWCLKYLDGDVCMQACAWTCMHIVGLSFEVSQNGFINWTIRMCKENLHNDKPYTVTTMCVCVCACTDTLTIVNT